MLDLRLDKYSGGVWPESHVLAIDVSRWQGSRINWAEIKASGVVLVIFKLTEGVGYKYAEWAVKQGRLARKAGLELAVYHFGTPWMLSAGGVDPIDEADSFLKWLDVFEDKAGQVLFAALDIEKASKIEAAKVGRDELTMWCHVWGSEIRRQRPDLVLYYYDPYRFARKMHRIPHYLDRVFRHWAADYWRPVGVPNLPPEDGWTAEEDDDLHQYTSDLRLPGADSKLDGCAMLKSTFYRLVNARRSRPTIMRTVRGLLRMVGL